MKGVWRLLGFVVFLVLLVTIGAENVSAALGDDLVFNGTVRDVNGSRLNNTLINITIWNMTGTGPQLIGSNSTYSNESGLFNFNVSGNESWLYKVVVTYTNQTTGVVDYVGPSTPHFPYFAFVPPPLETNINFYLRPAGTINITAINGTGGSVSFWYQVKDIKLGYTIASNFGSNNYVQEKIIYVPRDRNYSIMVNANQSVPVSFEWNNFSSDVSYNITNANLSFYNATAHTLHKQFNCTDSPVQIYGYINATGIDGWDDFAIVTYLLEPGSMVYLGAKFPYNMSFGSEIHNSSDSYNLTSGFYNITLPSSTETTNALLFAAARNGTDYYGGFRNISLSSSQEINFTMYGLLGNPVNITVQDAGNNWADKNISTKKQAFNLVNATTNATLENVNAYIEIKVDYSDYNCTEFTFMTNLDNENGTFYIPLINATGVKEINVYSMDYAPRRVGTKTAAEIQANNNITMFAFIKEGGIDPTDPISKSNLKAFVYMSNSTCSIPYPQYISAGDPCLIVGDVTMDIFNPLPAIIGGGKVDFSVKMLSTGIEVKYINVDFLASGPPDAKFDSAQTESTAGDLFSAALRFGSMGPTIYDYVLIGMPYTEGNTSQTGLDETEVNMSIPLFYDENWNVIWNTATNGTSGTNLGGNYSHYYEHRDEWETLMNGTTCTRDPIINASQINATHPCYIDTSRNLIWVRIPHFDGNSIRPAGGVITATPTPTPTDDGGPTGGGDGLPPEKLPSVSHSWDKLEPGAAVSMSINRTGLDFTQIQVQVKNRANDVSIAVTKLAAQPASVVHNVTGKVYQYVEIERSENINDTNVQTATINFRVNNTWISDNNIDKNTVALNRYANNQWNKLSTTLVSEDANYTYYSATTPGFSVFVVTGEVTAAQVCTPGAKQCVDNDLQQCKSDGSAWETTETCEHGCDPTNLVCYSELQPVCTPGDKRCVGNTLQECKSDASAWIAKEACAYGCNETTLACNPAPAAEPTAPSLWDYWWVFLIIIIAVVIAVVFLYLKAGAAG